MSGGAGRVACEGTFLSCVVSSLNASEPHSLSLVAHSPGGSSEPSAVATLLPAPKPTALVAADDGDCWFGANDVLTLSFDEPTNRALGEPPADGGARGGAGEGAGDGELELEPDAVATLLEFSTHVSGGFRGRWDATGAVVL